MSEFNVTTRYSKALLGLAEEKGIFDKVSSDMELIHSAIKDSKEFRSVMRSPVIAEEKKREILKALFEEKISKETMEFVLFVLEKNREGMLAEITGRFLELRDIKLGRVKVTVTSATELSGSQREKMEEKLAGYTGKKVKVDYKVNRDMIGGFSARIKDTVIDATVANQLANVKKKFLQSTEINS